MNCTKEAGELGEGTIDGDARGKSDWCSQVLVNQMPVPVLYNSDELFNLICEPQDQYLSYCPVKILSRVFKSDFHFGYTSHRC